MRRDLARLCEPEDSKPHPNQNREKHGVPTRTRSSKSEIGKLDSPTRSLQIPDPQRAQSRESLPPAARPDMRLSLATVDLNELHSVFVHAVAEARAPDLAILDSVWVTEFANSGFLYPLEDLDPGLGQRRVQPGL